MSFRRCELMEVRNIFYHPDYTVGIGIAPIQPHSAPGLYRRSGITPCPEDISIQLFYCLHYSTVFPECKYFFQEGFDSCVPGAYNGGHH